MQFRSIAAGCILERKADVYIGRYRYAKNHLRWGRRPAGVSLLLVVVALPSIPWLNIRRRSLRIQKDRPAMQVRESLPDPLHRPLTSRHMVARLVFHDRYIRRVPLQDTPHTVLTRCLGLTIH